MTNKQILETAMGQSAIDLNCQPEDFLLAENKIVYSKPSENARKYLTLPFDCNLVTYGGNIVASIKPELEAVVRAYIEKYPPMRCFETPNMHVFSEALEEYGLKICFMAEYFLPDVNVLRPLECGFETRILEQKDFSDLYKPEWSNALCEKRKELDVLGVGAYDNGKLIGLVACSADCGDMWQIGIDVLPGYRRIGVASALTSRLAVEIIRRGRVPFYCAAWSNIGSVRNAIKSGFRPAWVELTVKSGTFVDEMNECRS